MTESKIQQAFEKYNLELDDEQVRREVEVLLKNHLQENNTTAVKKFLSETLPLLFQE